MARSSLDKYASIADSSQPKQIEEGLKNSLGALVAVHEAGRILSATLSLDEIGTKLLNIAQCVSAFTAAVISLKDEHGQLQMLHARGPESLWRVASVTQEAQAARNAVLETKRRQAVRLRQSIEEGASLVGLHLPLVVRGRLTGVVEFYGPEALDEKAAVEILESITRQAASALENAKLHQELAQRERRLEDLASRLVKIREEERRRLAHDIHDGLVQVAVAAHQNLQAYANDYLPGSTLCSAKLNRALELAKQMVEEARHVIASLRPRELDNLGLAPALRSQIDSLRTEGWDLGYDEDLWEKRLSPEIETALYWISQEALANVRKHAQTTRVHVMLTQLGNNRVCLKVRDWGCGLDSTLPPEVGSVPGERVGLCGMRERVELLGGKFEIHSQLGAGTSVVAELPLAHATPVRSKQVSVSEFRPTPNRLVIADDHALVREGLRTMLASEPDLEVVGEAANGQETLELCRRLCPDLVLMDARMPKMDGLAATREIKAENPAIAILMLSTYQTPDYLLEAIRAGATGYVIKDVSRHDLVGAVREVLRGEHPLDHELTMQLLRILAGEDRQETGVSRGSDNQAEVRPQPLTQRELEVLRLLSQGQTNRQIALKLVVSAATVKVHVEHILAKLGVSDRTQAAVRASETGLLNSTG
jgi:DNA-binding NarL/FixJ family response regulator/signal transduction histidine kinase